MGKNRKSAWAKLDPESQRLLAEIVRKLQAARKTG